MRVKRRRTVLAIGPLPPPMNGMTVMTGSALRALANADDLNVVHLDTSDHRPIGNVERFDLTNAFLALRHGAESFVAIARNRPRLVYLPIAQGTLGFLRDSLFFGSARAFRCPTLVHFHGGEFSAFYNQSRPVMRWLIRWCLKSCVGAIVLGKSAADDLLQVLPSVPIYIRPNGIVGIPSYVRARHSPENIRVLYVSNLMWRKGYIDLLRAASYVIDADPRVTFVVAGGETKHSRSPEARDLINRATETGRISFAGEVTGLRKAELFSKADIFVFPPVRPEGHPLVLLEAMSAGVAIIATDIGGARETVVDGVTGLLVPAEAPYDLAKAIIKLATEEELRLSMGSAGRRRFNEAYSDRAYALALQSTLATVLGSASELFEAA